mmetsp:Transcript_12503/g.17050  ORF Transcript_12503/g.17050 Transcript_12503/m.17050 type:complete len:80 (+) Transcript_12503:197-436(+)
MAGELMSDAICISQDEAKGKIQELLELAGVSLKEEVFDVILELTLLDVVPTATSQVVKSLCGKARALAAASSTSAPSHA